MGDFMDTSTNTINHNIQINERKSAIISGVKKLESFDNKEFFLSSIMGYMLIKGEGLELVKLDTFQGTLSIKGKVNSITYLDDGGKKASKESVLSKLFK